MTRILALDPGNRVGWCRFDYDGDQMTDLRHGITPLWDMADAIYHNATKYDVIVYEKWALYRTHALQMTGSTFPSVQFIGAVKLTARLMDIQLVEQGASIKKVALAHMKEYDPNLYGLCTRGGKHDDLHDQDAIMHGYYYIALGKGSK